jgi:hypothetical protein
MKSSLPARGVRFILSGALALLVVGGSASYGCTTFESADESGHDAAAPDDGAAHAGTSYRDVVLGDHPVAYWRLGETAPEIHAHDETGTGNDGVYVGDVTLGAPGAIAGDPNGGIQMAGNAHVDIGDKLRFGGNVAMTIEAWVQTDPSTDQGFVDKTFGPGRDAYAFYIYNVHNAEGAQLRFTRDGTCITPDAGGLFGDARYHHLVASYDTATLRIFFDGELVCSAGFTSNLGASAGPLQLGSMNGRMDEVAIYDHVLAPATVKRHYDVGMGR